MAVLHTFGARGPAKVERYEHDRLEALTTQILSEDRSGQVLFLRGYASPDWISTIGSISRIDPEFINRHLAFLTSWVLRSAFSIPSLSSSCRNIITLRVCTILFQNGRSIRKESKSLASRRKFDAEGLDNYARFLQTTARYGDSIVRGFCTLDEQYSIIEQDISVCIQRSKEGWLGTC